MKKILSLTFLLAAAAVSTAALADLQLASAKNCMNCHGAEKKIVGPSYKSIAAKYGNQKDAADKLAVKVIKGGAGAWGAVPMPANPKLSEAEAKKLVAWILAHK